MGISNPEKESSVDDGAGGRVVKEMIMDPLPS